MSNDTEWDYEYHQHETEDLYFTLDLTTHVPDALPVHNIRRNGKRAAKEAESGELPRAGGGSELAEQPSGKLQFLDLHTRDPLVKFDNGVYSCNWHTDLGTQFFVSRCGGTSKPVRPGNVLDVAGTSQTRLLGQPVTLCQREDWAEGTAEETASTAAVEESLDATPRPSDLSSLRPGQQLVIPREHIKNPEQAAQASFFEQLSAIKLQKGEHDIIPVAGVKQYNAPTNKEEIRQRALAAAAVQEAMLTETLPATPPAKRCRKVTYAEVGKETKAAKVRRLKQDAKSTNGSTASPSQTMADPSPVQDPHQPATPTHTTNSTVQYAVPSTHPDPMVGSSVGVESYIGPAVPWHALPSTVGSSANGPGPSSNGTSIAHLLRPSGQGASAASTPAPARRTSRKATGP